ncbi:MAG TPA: hypothetical protein VK639_14755 [Terriglobales bacterium]|nr:hypothetical protein [Terriglobales bacterium]
MAQPHENDLKISIHTAEVAPGKLRAQSAALSPVAGAQFAQPQSVTGSNGYSLTNNIGKLRWEMSLGSIGRSLKLGRLLYQADVLDGTAYSPARLSLARGGDPSSVVTDRNGDLRQVKLRVNLVDIQGIANGIQIAVYPREQFDVLDPATGVFAVSGSPTLTWRVENPDATSLGRVLFTQTQGTNSEVHQAEWQGINSVAGTMTITRYGGQMEGRARILARHQQHPADQNHCPVQTKHHPTQGARGLLVNDNYSSPPRCLIPNCYHGRTSK